MIRTAPLEPSVELPLGPRSAVLGGEDACEVRHWDLQWSFVWCHETLDCVGQTHANCATKTFGGAPSGAAKRCTGRGRRMRTAPLGPSVDPPPWATKRCTRWGRRIPTAPLGAS
eukprot:804612-Pyramimonas_sp.AAC.1